MPGSTPPAAPPPRPGPRLAGLAALAALALGAGAAGGDAPRELGSVDWLRDHDAALTRARSSGHPVFALFQEVPGCQSCVGFGDRVLRHPLLVEAIETEFVPLAIYDNRGGADAAVLARYDEPSWNETVVRFLDAEGEDLLPREVGVRQPGAIARRMIAALEAADRAVPAYLRAAVDELGPHPVARATFAMHCFWSGEACLGRIPGLLSSRAGFLDGREVVEVSFDAGSLSYEALLREARERGCSEAVYVHTRAQEGAARAVFGERVTRTSGYADSAPRRDQKRSLRATRLRDVELTPRQAMRANAAIAAGRSPLPLLSPRQREAAGLDPAG